MTRILLLAASALTVVIVVATACGDDSSPVVEQPGDDGFRQFAATIQAALDNEDDSFFRERLQAMSGICTAENLQLGIGQLPCEFEGQRWEGFPTGFWHSEGGMMPFAVAQSSISVRFDNVLPSASDEFGNGAPRVYALTVGEAETNAVITALVERPPDFAGSGPLRAVRVTSWSFDGDRWRLTFLLRASVLAEEFLVPCEGGVDYLGGVWERYPDRSEPDLSPDLCLLV